MTGIPTPTLVTGLALSAIAQPRGDAVDRDVDAALDTVHRRIAGPAIPKVAVRQWVLSFPIPMRILLAAHPQLISEVLQIVHRVIATFLIRQSGLKRSHAHTGAVTLIQRFGSAANLNVHLHGLVLDGVYQHTDDGPIFHAARAPSAEELQALLAKIIARVLRRLTRRGLLVEEHGEQYLATLEDDDAHDPTLASLQRASATYRIAMGPRAGQRVLHLQSIARSNKPTSAGLCADAHGFSLHAAVHCQADQRAELERLCRYITRPAIANERLKRNRAGDVVLQLKSPYKDGTTHIVMSPLEFMQRLAALVPRPRLHLIRFHGVLAPHAKLRSAIVPQPVQGQADVAGESAPDSSAFIDPCACVHASACRISWARLLKRVFGVDLEHCTHCGGRLKIIAAPSAGSGQASRTPR